MKTSLSVVALSLALASLSAAYAAPRDLYRPLDAYNQTFSDPPSDEILFNRAKGNIQD